MQQEVQLPIAYVMMVGSMMDQMLHVYNVFISALPVLIPQIPQFVILAVMLLIELRLCVTVIMVG